MVLFSLVSILSIIFILWWGVYHLKQRKARFDIFFTTLKNSLDSNGLYKGRKVTYKIFSIPLWINAPYIILFLKKEHKRSWNELLLLSAKEKVMIGRNQVAFQFKEWSKKTSDSDYIIKILDRLSSVADKLESNGESNGLTKEK
jgi:hypothetical protein